MTDGIRLCGPTRAHSLHPLTLLALTLLVLAAFPRSSAAASRCTQYTPYSDLNTCPEDWSCIELSASANATANDPTVYRWPSGCNPVGVDIRIATSNITLDCAGGTMNGHRWLHPTTPFASWTNIAIRVRSGRVEFIRDEEFATSSCQDMNATNPISAGMCTASTPTEHVKVANCTIKGYTHGVRIEHNQAFSPAFEARITAEYRAWFRHPNERLCRVSQLEDCLRQDAPRHLEFDKVHISDTTKIGFYVGSYVNRVDFHHGSVRDANNRSPGVYLTYGTRNNKFSYSTFSGNGREGIAMDGSANNTIHHNVFDDNGTVWWAGPWTDRDDLYGAAITLFRNGWENAGGDNPSAPRAQHSSGNQIIANEIKNQWVGVWIGYRQDDGPPSHRSDPVFYNGGGGDSYFRPNAENNRVDFNVFTQTGHSIVIEDDRASVTGNKIYLPGIVTGQFLPPPATGIDVGSWVRRRVGDPVHQTIISQNLFFNRGLNQTAIRVHDCAFDNIVAGNTVKIGSTYQPVGASVGSCDRERMRLRFHKSRPDGSYKPASGQQQGGAFNGSSGWLVGDFDNDGIDDLVHAYISDDSQVRLWMHTGTGEELEYRSSFQTFPPLAAFATAGHMHWVVGNFDGRNGDDIALLATRKDTTWTVAQLWRSEGTGFVTSNQSVIVGDTLPATAREWLAADLDNNGTDELVFAYRTPAGLANVHTYAATTSFTFERRSSQSIGTWVDGQRWLIGDWNRDGNDDLTTVFSFGTAGAMSAVHLASSYGFQPFSWMQYVRDWGDELPLSARDRWLVTDFDGDGNDDLVRIAPSGSTARISRYRSQDNNLQFTDSQLLGDFHDDQVWLAGAFDCGHRDELVVIDSRGNFNANSPMADSGLGRICDPNADPPEPPPPSYVGAADDIVWQASNGQMQYWRMSGGNRIGAYNVYSPVSTAWVPRGVGDLNGDGHNDIVFQQTNGQVHYWPMRNGQRLGGVNIYSPVSSAWSLRGFGDVNGDGTDDIIWQAPNGQVQYWPMRNGQRQGGINIYTPVSSAWSLRGIGDVNGDGTDDIIWQASNGQVHYWPMRNGQRQGGIDIYTPVSTAWSLRDVGDVTGDGTADIVWQHSSGQVHYWTMRAGRRTGSGNIHTPVNGSWTLVGVGNVDPR